MFDWWREGDAAARRAFIAASLGWMLDSFDVMLYALLIPAIMRDLAHRPDDGRLAAVADAPRVSRRRTHLRRRRGSLGPHARADGERPHLLRLHRGLRLCDDAPGSWRSSASARPRHGRRMGERRGARVRDVAGARPRQARSASCRARGRSATAWPRSSTGSSDVGGFGWRAVFFVGVLPALFTLWVRRNVRSRRSGIEARRAAPPVPDASNLRRKSRRRHDRRDADERVHAVRLVGLQSVDSVLPARAGRGRGRRLEQRRHDLVRHRHAGRDVVRLRHLRLRRATRSAASGRTWRICCWRRSVVVAYDLDAQPRGAAGARPVRGVLRHRLLQRLRRGHGRALSDGRARPAQGFTYNVGRIASAAAPWLVGGLAETRGFPLALSTTAAAFVLAALLWLFIPETKGRALA